MSAFPEQMQVSWGSEEPAVSIPGVWTGKSGKETGETRPRASLLLLVAASALYMQGRTLHFPPVLRVLPGL